MSGNKNRQPSNKRPDDPVISFLGPLLGSATPVGDRIQPEARALAESLESEQIAALRQAIGQRALADGVRVTSGYVSDLISPYRQGASNALSRGDRQAAVRTLAAAEALGIVGRELHESERAIAMGQLDRQRAEYYSGHQQQ